MKENHSRFRLFTARFLMHRASAWACGFLVLRAAIASAADASTQTNQPVVIGVPWGPTEVSYICGSNKTEPTYQGLPISQWIQTKTSLNTNGLALSELLALKQVSAADEWGTVKFELPINYDAVANSVILGEFNKDGDFVECTFDGCERATSGHCLLWWAINYDWPGKHNIRVKLTCCNHWDSIEVTGPALPFYSSNACWFFEGSTLFNSTGAILQAKLREPAATYRIELKTGKGKHLKTISGSTTNGMIDLDWDLTGEHGKQFKGGSFEGFFYVTYPGDKTTNAPVRVIFNRIGG